MNKVSWRTTENQILNSSSLVKIGHENVFVWKHVGGPEKTQISKYSLIAPHDLAEAIPLPYEQGFSSLLLFSVTHTSSQQPLR